MDQKTKLLIKQIIKEELQEFLPLAAAALGGGAAAYGVGRAIGGAARATGRIEGEAQQLGQGQLEDRLRRIERILAQLINER